MLRFWLKTNLVLREKCSVIVLYLPTNLFLNCCNLSVGVTLNVWLTTSGMCAKNNNTYTWREQAIIEWSRHVNSIVACCHSAKLSAHSAWNFRSQQNNNFSFARMRNTVDRARASQIDMQGSTLFWEGLITILVAFPPYCSAFMEYRAFWVVAIFLVFIPGERLAFSFGTSSTFMYLRRGEHCFVSSDCKVSVLFCLSILQNAILT